MNESESFIEQWEKSGDEKAELLEELILVQADDIGKLDVNEVMLRYFENRQRLCCDTWDNDNQALRQLFSASCRVPRVRHFPGSAGKVVGNPKLPGGGRRTAAGQQRTVTVLTSRAGLGGNGGGGGGGGGERNQGQGEQKQLQLMQHQQQMEREKQQQPQQQQEQQQHTAQQLAEHLIASEDTYEAIEKELATLSEQLVEHSLNQAVYNSAVHQLAVRLVRRALDRASEQLGGRTSSPDASLDARIDAIAQELARSQERGDARELTFATERAESVAEGLLDQVMDDAAKVVEGSDD